VQRRAKPKKNKLFITIRQRATRRRLDRAAFHVGNQGSPFFQGMGITLSQLSNSASPRANWQEKTVFSYEQRFRKSPGQGFPLTRRFLNTPASSANHRNCSHKQRRRRSTLQAVLYKNGGASSCRCKVLTTNKVLFTDSILVSASCMIVWASCKLINHSHSGRGQHKIVKEVSNETN